MKFEFSRQIFIEFPHTKFHTEFRPLRAALVHAEGRTVMMKVIGAFRDYAEVPKNQQVSAQHSIHMYIKVYKGAFRDYAEVSKNQQVFAQNSVHMYIKVYWTATCFDY
jgi:hypothetical protein